MQVDVDIALRALRRRPSPRRPRDGGCRTLERTLDGVVRNPADSAALAEAGGAGGLPRSLPARACELGSALDARAPLTPGEALRREGCSQALCQRCPPEANTCAGIVDRALHGGEPGRATTRSRRRLRWNLENAGPGTPAACVALVRLALVPAATPGRRSTPAPRPLVTELAPPCAKAGHLPALRAERRGGSAGSGGWHALLATLAAASAQAAWAPVAPKQVTGAEAGRNAFDGKEKTGVDLGNGRHASAGRRTERCARSSSRR